MGYRMEYKTGDHDASYQKIGNRNIKLLAVTLIAFTLFIVGFFNRDRIVDFLLPGDPAVTKRAIHVFIAELREGEKPTDAFASFCEVIVNEAELS